jgi:protein-L-isoaspartate(D-aspartate) O-methyltransferase
VADIRTGEQDQPASRDPYVEKREAMVENQIRRRGLRDEAVLRVMGTVPRHEFVPPASRDLAYLDEPLGIGGGQTISQPFIVAAMTAALQLNASKRVLEIGAGSGYQSAVLALLSREVFGIEVRSDLAQAAAERLKRLGYHNVHIHCGDGSVGLKEFAPFDAILVAAAAPAVPGPLLEQMSEGARLIVPVGCEDHQQLVLITRRGNEYSQESREDCRFVPLLGRHGWKHWELL